MTDAVHIDRHAGELPASVDATVQELLEATMGMRKPGLGERLAGYPATLVQVAHVDGRPAGFKLGYQEKPGHFYSWLGGVHPDFRRRGLGRALMRDQHAWLSEQGFRVVTMKTRNQWRNMLLLSIAEGFRITGVEHRPDDAELMIWLRMDLVSA
jgi:ribosomal protein S18 acetylase RimI-like enzyme